MITSQQKDCAKKAFAYWQGGAPLCQQKAEGAERAS